MSYFGSTIYKGWFIAYAGIFLFLVCDFLKLFVKFLPIAWINNLKQYLPLEDKKLINAIPNSQNN